MLKADLVSGEWRQLSSAVDDVVGLCGDSERGPVSEQVLVARMVSAAVGRSVSAQDSEVRWRQEVQLLRDRIERMGRMEEAIERLERTDAAARETLKRRILHGTLALCCGTVGVAGAIVFMTKIRAQG